jgi:hypothetical protein
MKTKRARRIVWSLLLLLTALHQSADAATDGAAAGNTGSVALTLPLLSLRPASSGSNAAVKIDPTIGMLVSVDGQDSPIFLPIAADTYLVTDKDQPNGTAELLVLQPGRTFVLVKPDLSPLHGIDPAKITDAKLCMTIGWKLKDGNANLSAYQMLTPWTEDATWTHPVAGATWTGPHEKQDYEPTPLASLNLSKVTTGKIAFDGLAGVVRSWLADESKNQGLLIRFKGSAQQLNLFSRERAAKVQAAGAVAAENPPSVTLSSQSAAALELNIPLLKAATLAPEDLLDAKIRLKLMTDRKAFGSQPAAAVELHLLHAGSANADPAAAREAKLSAEDTDNFLTIPVPAALLQDAIKNNGDARFMLTLANAGSVQLEIASHRPKVTVHTPQFLVSVAHHPNEMLFEPPVEPRPGVFVKMKDGHFDYGGERLRLWGVTMTARPNPEMADRIRKMGFNAVRFWGPPDFYDKDAPADGAPISAEKAAGTRLESFERQFAAMEQTGLFIDCTALMDAVPINTDDNSWLKPIGGNDWESWRSAITGKDKPDKLLIAFAASFDERLLATRKRHAQNFLLRVNPFTHKKYGEDESIAFFELGNERAFLPRLADRGFDKWPEYFRTKLQKRWNAWLRDRYKDDHGLDAAWGKRAAGESLADDTVHLAPLLIERSSYPHVRGDDFIHFIIDLTDSLNEQLETYARSLARANVGVAVVPFSDDTQYAPSLPWLFADTRGDITNFGTYVWGLTSALTAPPSLYVMDSSTVEGKATVIYETNVGAADPCRAEYPMRTAALASYEDWDAVFWHMFYGVTGPSPVPDEQYAVMPTKYMNGAFYWLGVEFETDPVLLSSIAAAGQVFIRNLLAPATHPASYVAGAKAIYGYDQFHGVSMGRSTFATGARIRFDPKSQTGITVDGNDGDALRGRVQGAVASGKQILWDWPNGRLIVDAPSVKAYVGKPAGNYRFSDGIVVGDFAGGFVCFAMASANGEPLLSDSAKCIYLTCVAGGRNAGFQMNMKDLAKPDGILVSPTAQGSAIESPGHAPVVNDAAPFHLWWPRTLHATLASFDFALRKSRDQSLSDNQLIWTGAPAWMNVLSIQDQGSPVQTPAMTTIAAAPAVASAEPESAVSQAAAGPALDIYNPLPDLDWSDIYPHAHQKLRDGTLVMTKISDESANAAGDNQITLTDAQIACATATIEVKFVGGSMTAIDFTFGQAPDLNDFVATLEKQLGPPEVKTLASSADKITTVEWRVREKAADMDVDVIETQGVLTANYKLTRK